MSAQEQTADAAFFLPVVAAWTTVLLGLELARRLRPHVWPAPASRGERPWLDVGVALFVAAAILALGQLWHRGMLQWHWPGAWQHLAFVLAQLVIWSPLFVALLVRRQPLATAWTGTTHLPTRLGTGALLGTLAVTIYLAARGDLQRWPAIAARATTWRAIAHGVPVWHEGVGLAFLFVRLQWAMGRFLAVLVPGLLFAVAHVPRAIADHETLPTMLAFFVFNTAFVAVLLAALTRYRDVVALGVAHWLFDLAIAAF